MKSRHISSNISYTDKGDGDEAEVTQLSEEIVLGDLIWVRLHDSSWWPAQVVDDNAVSHRNKSRNKSVNEVLVRLYGSYKYMYVDPMSCRSEFENVLEQNNGNYSEILEKTLEQDLACLKSGRAKAKGSIFKGKVRIGSPRDKQAKQNITKKVQEIEYPISTSGDLGSHPAASVHGTRTLKTDLEAKTSLGNASEIDGTEQHSLEKNLLSKKQKHDAVQKKLEPNSFISKRVSPRRLFLKNTEEKKSEKRKEVRVQKKLGVGTNHSNSVRSSPRLSAASKPQTMLRNGELLPENVERGRKNKDQNQDVVPKKHDPNSSNFKSKELVKSKAAANQEGGMQKKLKPETPSPATTSAEKSQELTTRRRKVMQTLGLIAPSGSPFHRNGQI